MFNFNISSLFGGGSSGGFGFINYNDYRMIKNGSYKKLMKAYYADQKGSKTSKKSSGTAQKMVESMNRTDTKDTTGVSKMKTQADSLKTAAEAFDKSDVFKQKDGAYDTEQILKTVNDFVSKYNSTIDQSAKTVSKDVSTQVGYMESLTGTMSKALSNVGITVGTDGKLSVNEDTLKNANMKDLEALFSGKHSYAAEIANKAAAIENAAIRSSSIYASNGAWSNSLSGIFSSRA